MVGAALAYGHKALEVAAAVKLARVLWIVPVALGLGLIRKQGLGTTKGHRPWFILGFLAAAGLLLWGVVGMVSLVAVLAGVP